MITEEDYVALVRREIEEAQGYDSDQLASERAAALDYYYGKLPAAAPEGRSQVVSYDVADAVHSLLSQISKICTTSVVSFEPRGVDDEPQAQAESDFVQRMIERTGGYEVLYSALFNALLQGNGYIKVDIENEPQTSEQRYSDLTDDEKAVLAMPQRAGEQVKITEHKNGDCTVKRAWTEQNLKIRNVNPDRVLMSNGWNMYEFQELRFFGERLVYSQSELRKLGVPDEVIERLPDAKSDWWPAVMSREGTLSEHIHGVEVHGQEAERLVECYDCHLRVDIEENGRSELRRVLISGRDMLLEQPAPFIPYVTGSPIPLPGRVVGQGMYHLMKEVQDSKTAIKRKFQDSLEVNIAGLYEAVEGKVNLDDISSARTTGIIRTRAPGSLTPLHSSQSPADAIMGLNYWDTVREQRGGAAVDLNDADRQLMQSSATAAAGAMANHEKMAGWYAQNLVNSLLKGLFRVVHETMRIGMPEPQAAKLRGKWVEQVPADWPPRDHLDVLAGMTTDERNRKIMGLNALMALQMQWFQAGYDRIIVDGGKIHQAAADWIRANDLGDPASFMIDPDSPEAQQAAQEKAQQAEAERDRMEQLQSGMIQLQVQLEQQKIELDKYKHDSELRYKYYDSNLDAEVKEAEMTADSLVEMEKARSNGSGSASAA